MRRPRSDSEAGWTPLLYLIFLGFFLAQPVFEHAGWKEWTADVAAIAAFLALYFPVWWVKSPKALWYVGAMVALGAVYLPFNPGASTFFIYAAASLGFVTQPERAFKLLVGILSIAGVEIWLTHGSVWFWVCILMYSAVIGAANIHYGARNRVNARLRQAREEVERLAQVAERERIARDMHDVLGHTLSVIVLKSELASRLVESDPARARKEMVEVEQTAREALAEVRLAIRGYRAESIEGEMSRAKATLETAGLQVECESERVALSPAQETVLALVIREAVTNVVRHAQAQWCRLKLARSGKFCLLEIYDDGRGGLGMEGNGLRGMRERIEALEGTLVREGAPGTRLIITLPLA